MSDNDEVMKMNVLTADAVELGRRVLNLSFTVAGRVCVVDHLIAALISF